MKDLVPTFNLETVEDKMLNYYCQADSLKTQKMFNNDVKYNVKYGTNTIDINATELGKQAVKEHKDIHKLVASKMFDVKYEDVTDEQRRIAKTVNFKYLYKVGLI